METIEIFFDTNFLRNRNHQDYSKFQFGSEYSNFIDFISSKDLIESCHVNITEIVLEELKKQFIDSFKEEDKNLRNLIKKFRVYYNFEEPDYKDIIRELDKKIIEYLINENINLVLIPKDRSVFNSIIDRAINKEKPFSGKDKESDKGFKDVLQWESMIEYAKKIDANTFLYITKNKNDFPEEIGKEFEIKTSKKIEIFYEIGELQNRILEINKIHSNYLLVDAIIKSLLDSGELIDIINEKIKLYYEAKIEKIINYNNLTDQNGNHYSFDIEAEEENGTAMYNIECTLEENENIIITDVVVCK